MNVKRHTTQKSPQTQIQYDEYGWPINPATGDSYTFRELVADPTLPLPKFGQSVEAARARAAGQVARLKQRRRNRSNGKPKKSINYAEAVLWTRNGLTEGRVL